LERQDQDRKKIAAAETQALEAAYKNPLKPMLSDSWLTRGRPDAKYTLVMYGDFQCPYCRQALATVATLRKSHGDNLRVVYKHMPLSFHSEAERVAQWVEAASLQSKEKAWQFHDIAYESQDKLSLRFLRDTARKLRIDAAKCERDADSKIVRDRISADIKEAQKFGLEGTPGFLLNGIPVKGAFPVEHFEAIIDRLDRTSSAKAPQGGQETTALR
jgi:protein-disulfide isomerase